MKKIIGTIIRNLRKSKGLSQQKLSEIISCSRPSISEWERGVKNPDSVNLLKLDKVFDGKLFEALKEEALK